MYYLWLNDTQSGPFTLQQVQSMWNAGQVTTLTLYWQEGMAEWQPLSAIQPLIEPTVRPGLIAQTAVLPPFEQHPAAIREAAASAAAAHVPEEEVWRGNPTWWRWAGALILVVLLALAPLGLIFFLGLSLLLGIVTLPLAAIIFLYIYLVRDSTRYSITNKRVSLQTGILNKTSRELRIQDIRAIGAKTNILGYGDLEFSSAAKDDDVIFFAVPRAAKIRDLVKTLQS